MTNEPDVWPEIGRAEALGRDIRFPGLAAWTAPVVLPSVPTASANPLLQIVRLLPLDVFLVFYHIPPSFPLLSFSSSQRKK